VTGKVSFSLPKKKLQIELVQVIYGEDGNPKRQIDVRKAQQKQPDSWKYDFVMINKQAGNTRLEARSKSLI